MLAAQAKERQRESQKNFHGNQHTGMGQNSASHQKSKIKQKKQMLLNRLKI